MKSEQEVREELVQLRHEREDIESALCNTESDEAIDDLASTQARIDALEWVLC